MDTELGLILPSPSLCPMQERELSPEELDGEQRGQGGDMGLGEWQGTSSGDDPPWRRGLPCPRRALPQGDTVSM